MIQLEKKELLTKANQSVKAAEKLLDDEDFLVPEIQ